MKDAWKDQFSILNRGKEDFATDAIIKDTDSIIKRRIHVGFIKQQIEKYTEPGELVWDPFCGCGSTGIAAMLSNRKAVLGDIGAKEIELTKSRISRLMPNDEVKIEQIDILKSNISNVDFVFTSPPILDYDKCYSKVSSEIGRAEDLTDSEFKIWLDLVAQKIKVGMKDKAYCCIYTADLRSNKKLLPYGFLMLDTFSKHMQIVDIVIVSMLEDSRRKRRCVDLQENKRMRHSVLHDYMHVFQKL